MENNILVAGFVVFVSIDLKIDEIPSSGCLVFTYGVCFWAANMFFGPNNKIQFKEVLFGMICILSPF